LSEPKYIDPEELRKAGDFKYKDINDFLPLTNTAVIVMFDLGQLGIGKFDSVKKKFCNVNDPFEEQINDKWLWTYSTVRCWKAIA